MTTRKPTDPPISRRRALQALLGTPLLAVAGTARTEPVSDATSTHLLASRRLAGVKSWGYQLQGFDMARIARSPYDLLVIDYSRDGSDATRWSASQLRTMRGRAGRPGRLLLAYVSIGEAEDYRFYWQSKWVIDDLPDEVAKAREATRSKLETDIESAYARGDEAAATAHEKELLRLESEPLLASDGQRYPQRPNPEFAPSWLGSENDGWRSNYHVSYWDRGWQEVLFGTPSSYLEKVLAMGFDGVCLDRVDAYHHHLPERPTAKQEMAELVVSMAERARSLKPDCIVTVQNGEELLLEPGYLAAIDGIVKEDLFFGPEQPTFAEAGVSSLRPSSASSATVAGQPAAASPAIPNPPAWIGNSLAWLAHAENAGRRVLVAEYLPETDRALIAQVRAKVDAIGYVPFFGVRDLDRLVLPDDVPARADPAPARSRTVNGKSPQRPKSRPQEAKARPEAKTKAKVELKAEAVFEPKAKSVTKKQ